MPVIDAQWTALVPSVLYLGAPYPCKRCPALALTKYASHLTICRETTDNDWPRSAAHSLIAEADLPGGQRLGPRIRGRRRTGLFSARRQRGGPELPELYFTSPGTGKESVYWVLHNHGLTQLVSSTPTLM